MDQADFRPALPSLFQESQFVKSIFSWRMGYSFRSYQMSGDNSQPVTYLIHWFYPFASPVNYQRSYIINMSDQLTSIDCTRWFLINQVILLLNSIPYCMKYSCRNSTLAIFKSSLQNHLICFMIFKTDHKYTSYSTYFQPVQSHIAV